MRGRLVARQEEERGNEAPEGALAQAPTVRERAASPSVPLLSAPSVELGLRGPHEQTGEGQHICSENPAP